jgi:hypothetical protein
MALARVIRTLAGLVAAVIVTAILLKLLSANPHNEIVSDIHDAGAWLATPFKHLFNFKSGNVSLAVNWGLAALVYLVVGSLLASLVGRAAVGGMRRVRPVA